MTVLARVLEVLSALLILVGLVAGGVVVKSTERRLKAERATITRIRDEVQALPEVERDTSPTLTDRLRFAGVPFATYADALTQRQDIELTVIDYLKPALSWPFGLAVVGTVLGLVVAIFDLFLP